MLEQDGTRFAGECSGTTRSDGKGGAPQKSSGEREEATDFDHQLCCCRKVQGLCWDIGVARLSGYRTALPGVERDK
jgi:hypothetical protein